MLERAKFNNQFYLHVVDEEGGVVMENHVTTTEKDAITPEMIEAGIAALEDELVNGYSVAAFRRDLVSHVYLVMRAIDQTVK
jgi:hypothetical protein